MKFWFHGQRNAFITGTEPELMLPHSLTKQMVNHARHSDVTEGCAPTGQWSGYASRLSRWPATLTL